MNVKQAVPFFGVASMEASLRFYMDGLGFVMKVQMDRRGEAALVLAGNRGGRADAAGIPTRR